MKILERIRDWLHERTRRRPKTFTPVSDLSQDYDFHMLIQTELAAIKPNIRAVRRIVKDGYVQLGGNYDNARTIFVTVACYWLEKRLREKDLPGPDDIIVPKIVEFAGPFIAQAFDDFFNKP